MEYKRVNNDVYGNPRYVFHYSEFLNEADTEHLSGFDRILRGKTIAVNKARQIGGKAYKGKDFGGGIVIQSYNIQDTIKQIEEIQKQPA